MSFNLPNQGWEFHSQDEEVEHRQQQQQRLKKGMDKSCSASTTSERLVRENDTASEKSFEKDALEMVVSDLSAVDCGNPESFERIMSLDIHAIFAGLENYLSKTEQHQDIIAARGGSRLGGCGLLPHVTLIEEEEEEEDVVDPRALQDAMGKRKDKLYPTTSPPPSSSSSSSLLSAVEIMNQLNLLKAFLIGAKIQLSGQCTEIRGLQEIVKCKERQIQHLDRECGSQLNKIQDLQTKSKSLMDILEAGKSRSTGLMLLKEKTDRIEHLENILERKQSTGSAMDSQGIVDQDSIEKVRISPPKNQIFRHFLFIRKKSINDTLTNIACMSSNFACCPISRGKILTFLR